MPQEEEKKTISKPKPLKIFDSDSSESWRSFKKEWEDYEEASGLDCNSSTERVVTFLRVLGKDGLNIYNSFSWEEEKDSRNIDRVIEKFEGLCLSDKSTRFQRYLFYKREQETGEKLEDYVSDIKVLSAKCCFGDLGQKLLCDKIVFGLKDHTIREELLKSEVVDVDKLVEVINEKKEELEKKQQEKLKALDKLKRKKKKGKLNMADEIEMLGLEEEEEETNGEGEENGENKMEDAEEADIIFEAGSDIDEGEEENEDKKEEKPASAPQTKRDTEFTSEDFKIELSGLPRYYAMGQLKKLLNETLQLKAHKIKPAGANKDWAYITFRDEKSRTKALAVLDEYQWKKCTLNCKIARAVEDPVAAKAKPSPDGDDSKLLEGEDPDAKLPINERVMKSVTPLAHRTYEDQLKEKQKAALAALKKLGKEMSKTNPELKDFLKFHKQRRNGNICEVGDIIPSPVTEGYRNKCEFTVGINPEDELPTVGFRVSSYKSGSLAVGPVEHLVHIPDTMKSVVKVFQEYVRESEHKPFDPLTHEGVWRQLNVRTSAHDDILIAVVIHPQDFTEEQIGDLKQHIVDYFRDGGGAPVGVTSIFFQAYGQKAPGLEETELFEHLWGEKYITETVCGKTFRISCESFFQVNTKACEVLYETIGDLAELDGTSVILDVCCGTGTIGISLADQCVKVYGIEMVKKAAEDARHNAELNGLGNVAIYTGKAEVNMNPVLAQCVKYNTIGVVDPPRAGLAESVVRALRKCDNMNRMIYMSCDPDGAFKNFVDLTRPKSKNYKGEFFVPIKAAIVDMFPHTSHYELLIVFERWEERKWRRMIEGNPLPRDQEYYSRIPPKPEGAEYEDSSDDEAVAENTGMGSWQSIGRNKGGRDPYMPYRNPRRDYADERQRYRGGGMDGNGYGGIPSLMGRNPYEDMYSGGRSRGPSSSYDSYYNEDRYGRMGGMSGMQGYGGGGMNSMQGMMGGYQEGPSDPYRLLREDWDRDVPFTARYRGALQDRSSGRPRKQWY